jgi:hypothetical protein
MTRVARLFHVLLVTVSLAVLSASPLAAEQAVLTGEQADDVYGTTIRGVGDLNGDGLGDFAVGAPGNDDGGSEAGRVYIYFGRAENLPGLPDLVLTGEGGGDAFGNSVAGLGRFNADSYDDLAVGAPLSDAGGSQIGRVYVFYGGQNMNDNFDLFLPGGQAGAHFGHAVGGGFDFNDDGFGDLVVGAPDMPANGFRSGEVRVFYGGSFPSQTPAAILAGDTADDQFGWSVDGAGDYDDDGFGDIVVGAPQPFAANSGRAYVIFGRNTTNPPTRLPLIGDSGSDRFGWSVAGARGIGAASVGRIAVGAPQADHGATNNGAVYVYTGGSRTAGTPIVRGGRSGGDKLGMSVAIGGDHNADGTWELLAGAPEASDMATNAGEIVAWWGSALTQTLVIPAPNFAPGFQADDYYGWSVDFVDYNNDGADEILGGAPDGNLPAGDEAGIITIDFFPGTLVPIVLEEISVVPSGGNARLTWKAVDDGTLLGFHVERRQPEGPWKRLTASPLAGAVGGRYLFEDKDPVLQLGGIFEYQLVILTRNGLTDTIGPWQVAFAPSIRPLIDQNYPNPFAAPATVIPIHLPEASDATVEIFEMRGRLVRRLHGGPLPKGVTMLSWDGTDDRGNALPSGQYVMRLEAGKTSVSRKVTLAR